MSKPDNQYEELARDAAKRIGESRDLAEQLSLLPSEPNEEGGIAGGKATRGKGKVCLLYTSPSPRDKRQSRMPSSA